MEQQKNNDKVYVIGSMIGMFIIIMLIPHIIKLAEWIVQQPLWVTALTVSLWAGIVATVGVHFYNKMWD